MTHHRSVLAVALLTATLGLTACSGSGSTTSTSGKSTGAGGSTSDTSASTPTSSTASSGASTGGSAKAAGMCSFIDQKAAESILGFSTKAGLAAAKTAGSGSSIKKLDGCIYQSMTEGTLGYDVLQVDGQLGRMMLGSAKDRMKAASKTSTTLTVFDAGIPDSVSYTMHVGTGVDSQVAVVSGDKFITVAVARKDGNVAKSQTAVKAAAKQLLSAA